MLRNALLPVVTVSVLVPEVIWKSAFCTVTLMATEFVTLPLVPVSVTVPVRTIPSRFAVEKPGRVAVTEYVPGRRSTIR